MPTIHYLKRCWKHSHLSTAEEEHVQAKVRLLADHQPGRLNLHRLEVEPLAGTRHKWKRYKFGQFRVFFIHAADEIIIGEIHRRDSTTYADVAHLNQFVLTRRGDGIDLIAPPDAAPPEPPASAQAARLPAPTPARRHDVTNPLTPFTTPELGDAGLPAHIIRRLRTFGPGIDVGEELVDEDLAPELVELILGLWTAPDDARRIYDAGGVPTLDDVTIGEVELARRVAHLDSSRSLAELTDEEFGRVLAGSVEEWMFYLHPNQARIGSAEPSGPLRVRGGPGTGKTVVALHRARWLVQHGHAERVLMTTFTRVLPTLWQTLFAAFAPAESGRIESATIDKIAAQVVRDNDGNFTAADHREALKLQRAALHHAGVGELTAEAFQTEIDQVILGRRLNRDTYLAVERHGRGNRLSRSARERVWSAYEEYRTRLKAIGKTDWPHMRARALELIEAGHGPRYDAIIVDEAQDLTEAHLRLLLALDADPTHKNLLLVGDGQQRIYPGGYTLRSVGIDIRGGRSRLLRTNWRNTQLIQQAAASFVGDLEFGDLDDDEKRHRSADALPLPQRLGQPPVLHICPDEATTSIAFALALEALLERHAPEDVAVLVQTSSDATATKRLLRGRATRELADHAWAGKRGISVGTHQRSKGLEFKAVVLMNVDEHAIRVACANASDEDDALEVWIRTVFVAMTRARDELVVVATAPLAPQLLAAVEDFDVHAW